jgi:hypothetical protein
MVMMVRLVFPRAPESQPDRNMGQQQLELFGFFFLCLILIGQISLNKFFSRFFASCCSHIGVQSQTCCALHSYLCPSRLLWDSPAALFKAAWTKREFTFQHAEHLVCVPGRMYSPTCRIPPRTMERSSLWPWLVQLAALDASQRQLSVSPPSVFRCSCHSFQGISLGKIMVILSKPRHIAMKHRPPLLYRARPCPYAGFMCLLHVSTRQAINERSHRAIHN